MNNNEKVERKLDLFARKEIFSFSYWFDPKEFNNKLNYYNALVAGGFILQALTSEPSSLEVRGGGCISDIDIYVNKRNATNVLSYLTSIANRYKILNNKYHQAPPYDQSFFRKNGILYRIHFKLQITPYTIRDIDLMIVDDNKKLTDVCSNFDLTFCEVWWDGKNVSTWSEENMENLLNKRGRLREEYQDALFNNFNEFIAKRITKYVKRGFDISYECENGHIVKKPKQIISPETYLVYGISNSIYYLMRRYNKDVDQFNKWLVDNLLSNNATLRDLEEMVTRNNFIKNMKLSIDYGRYFPELPDDKSFYLLSMICSKYFEYYQISYKNYESLEIIRVLNDYFNMNVIQFSKEIEPEMSKISDTCIEIYKIPQDYLSTIVDILAKRGAIRDVVLKETPALEEITDVCYDFLNVREEEVELHPIQIRLTEINRELTNAMSSRNIPLMQRLNVEKMNIMKEHSELLERLKIEQDTSHKKNTEHLNNTETFILVLDEDTIICYTVEDLLRITSDYNKWLIECKGDFISGTNHKSMGVFSRNGPFYVGITVDESEMKAFVDVLELLKIVELVRNEEHQVFYVKPKQIALESTIPFIFEKLDDYIYQAFRTGEKISENIDPDDFNITFGPILGPKLYEIMYNIKLSNKLDEMMDDLNDKFRDIDLDQIREEQMQMTSQDLYISHTLNYEMAFNPSAQTMVSANHCQEGSSILVYEIFLPQY